MNFYVFPSLYNSEISDYMSIISTTYNVERIQEFIVELKKKEKTMYLVLALHEDISDEHQKYCYCGGILDDCYVRPLTTLSYTICTVTEL